MKLSVHDLQDSQTVLMTINNDTEDVDLTFNLISKVYIFFQVNPYSTLLIVHNFQHIYITRIIRKIAFYRTVHFPRVA